MVTDKNSLILVVHNRNEYAIMQQSAFPTGCLNAPFFANNFPLRKSDLIIGIMLNRISARFSHLTNNN